MKLVAFVLAQKLKEKGFPQRESDYMWYDLDGKLVAENMLYAGERFSEYSDNYKAICSAPTADEILDLLPVWIKDEFTYFFNIQRDDKEHWSIYYEYNNLVVDVVLEAEGKKTPDKIRGVFKGVLADAAAQMWIYLKENNLSNGDYA